MDKADLPSSTHQELDSNDRTVKNPRDTLELVVHECWRQALEITNVPLDVDFFELGGDSLKALTVVSLIEDRLSVKIPVEVILEGNTVERFSQAVRTYIKIPPTPLVRLKDGPPKTVVAFVHPLGGGVIWYKNLVDSMPVDVRCIGFQACGLDVRVEPHRSIPEMAECYTDKLLEEFPVSSIVLVGYSMGGLIAYDIAWRLSAADRPPKGLLLIDAAPVPPGTPSFTRAHSLWSLLGHALELEFDFEELAQLTEEEVTSRALQAAVTRGRLPQDFSSARLLRLIDVYQINGEAMLRYEAPDHYPGILDIVLAEDQQDGSVDPWHEYHLGGIRLHHSKGTHLDITSRENSPAIAEVITSLWMRE